MFSDKDKIKELVEFFAQHADASCLISENKMYKPVGISVVMTYKYSINDMEIIYDKWYVQNYDNVKNMGLPGTEHHDQLVKGSGVMVLSKKLGSFVFHGHDANDIINACEYGRDMESYMVQNIRQNQK